MAQFIAGRKPLPKAQRRTKRIRFQTDTRLSGSQIYPRLQRLFCQSDDPENMREQGWAWAEGEGVHDRERVRSAQQLGWSNQSQQGRDPEGSGQR